jgi:hypothetical protein
LNENHDVISLEVRQLLNRRNFFNNLQDLAHILKQIKIRLLNLNLNACNLSDCYLNLVKLAFSINNIPIEYHKNFRNYCIDKFNQRWREFECDEYILAFFLNPAYKGNFIKYLKLSKSFIYF